MSNMFSESKHKKFPRSVRACMETDPVSSGLWDWAATVERYGKFLLVATIILGIILFLSALFSDERGQAGFAFKVILPVTVLVSIGEYLSYHTIALLICALASITQNTAISANMALYSAKDDPTVSAE